ncbi:MAG TPA: universal stress protein [Acidimicrobiales bacterium]|jgi:nucleotide-binding universal stress UspA family protein
MRVLVGIDGSELSHHAAQQARAMLRDDAEITLITVVKPPPPGVATSDVAPIGTYADSRQDDHFAVHMTEAGFELAASAKAIPDVDAAATMVVPGDPGLALCEQAELGNYDLLVVGSHGSGVLKQVVMGSVSQHVLHHAPCLVLVVPGGPHRRRTGGILRRRSRPTPAPATVTA